MDRPGSGGGRLFGRFTDQALLVLDRARAEAERAGHRYLGPERVLLGMLGIDLKAVRQETEQACGFQAVGKATWRVTRRRWWRGARVVWPPLCGPPFVAKRALQLASEQARALGHGEVTAEHRSPGVLEDARQPAEHAGGSRRHRQITAHVGLPDGYRGAARPLLEALGVDLDQLRDAVTGQLGRVQR
jgi:ATP-dependent Clp protease ATP-binding subunit ClpA